MTATTPKQRKPYRAAWLAQCLASACLLGLFVAGHDLSGRIGWEDLSWSLFGPLLIAGFLAPLLGALLDDTERVGRAAVIGGVLLLLLSVVDGLTGLTLSFSFVAPVFVFLYALTTVLLASRLARFGYLERIRLAATACGLQLLIPGLIMVFSLSIGGESRPFTLLAWAVIALATAGTVMAVIAVLDEQGRPVVDPGSQITGQMSTLRSLPRNLRDLIRTAVFFAVFIFATTLLLGRVHDRLIDSPVFFSADRAHGAALLFALIGIAVARRAAARLGLKRVSILGCLFALFGILGLALAGNSVEVVISALFCCMPAGIGLASTVATSASVVPDHKAAQGLGWLLLCSGISLAAARALQGSGFEIPLWTLALIFAIALILLQEINPARAARLNLAPGGPPPAGIVDLDWSWSVCDASGQGRHTAISTSIRYLARTLAEIFFSEIRVTGRENLRFDKGAIIVANHPNTFFDPMLLTAVVPARLSYLAKSTLWRQPILGPILDRLGAIPLYRRQDGGNTDGNQRSLEAAARRLHQQGLVLIFPEGVSEPGLSLKPVKTGAARLGFMLTEATDWQAETPLIPIAIDYAEPSVFRSAVTIRIGKPIVFIEYREAYGADPRGTVATVTDGVAERLKNMLPHLDDPALERLVNQILELYGSQLQQILDTDDETEARKAITEAVNHYQRVDPDTVYLFSERLETYERERERMATPENHPPIPLRSTLKILTSLFSPASIGLLINWIPYHLTGRLVSVFGAEPVWLATSKLGFGALIFVIWYTLLWLLGNLIAGPLVSSVFVILTAYAAFLAMGAMDRFAFRFRQLRMVWQLIWTQDTNDDLEEMRVSLIQDLERFRESYAFYHDKERD